MNGTLSLILSASVLIGFAVAAVAPPPSRPVAGWVQVGVGLVAPLSFCFVMALTSAGERDAGAIAMWVLATSLATLLWVLRAPGGEDEPGEGGDDDGGIGRGGPRGGPGTPDDGLTWDWDRFETEFASYAAGARDRELITTAR